MQLLFPDDDLVGIAVEGLHPADEAAALSETVEIADVTLYFGERPTIKGARKVCVVQFKYSISKQDVPFRASDAKKTVSKFASTYRDFNERYGASFAGDRLEFELITNRPVLPALTEAIEAIAQRASVTGDARKQAEQIQKSAGIDGDSLARFAKRLRITGVSGSLSMTKTSLSNLLVDWSATNDTRAAARLGQLRELVRQKAGSAGSGRNVVERTDVLEALVVSDASDLLPCPASLADVGDVVPREQLSDAVKLLPELELPLLVHAAGGVGKTVFLQSLSSAIQNDYEIVFFDCFGGGAYRSPEDSRHLPRRGLVHIANTLAVRGLCDPILPDGDDIDTIRTFRRRLSQCIRVLESASCRGLALFLDAIDNAAGQARDAKEKSFPDLLIESLLYEPLRGVKLVVSCRSHRRLPFHASCHEFELQPFSTRETETFLRARLPNVSDIELSVARARSGGNPRILDYLLQSDRGVLDHSEIDKTLELDALIESQIVKALAAAKARGYKQQEIDAFLAGLGALPPPVPIAEYAAVHEMDIAAVQSFVSDLWPMLELTKHGLMFRDEPTETFVRERYGATEAPLRRLATNLLKRQAASVYAARALPGLLRMLGDEKRLFQLAFDVPIPSAITSTVGKRRVRYARLQAAARHAATHSQPNQLVHLLLELSTIAAVNQRGTDYIVSAPDLVIAARDVDATRRLFETRTNWPGARHARLVIANTLSGDTDEAARHASMTREWLRHYTRNEDRQDDPRTHPERIDVAAIPVFQISVGREEEAVSFMRGWKDWFGFEVAEHIFSMSELTRSYTKARDSHIEEFIDSIGKQVGCLSAALAFRDHRPRRRKKLLTLLAEACKRKGRVEFPQDFHRTGTYKLQDGLRKASALAMSLGLQTEAMTISKRAPHDRPAIWAFGDLHYRSDVFEFVFRVALVSAAKKTPISPKDLLPKELASICGVLRRDLSVRELTAKAKARLAGPGVTHTHRGEDKETVSHDDRRQLERFLDTRLEPMVLLGNAFSRVLAARSRSADRSFKRFLAAWRNARSSRDPYARDDHNRFVGELGNEMATFLLWSRSELSVESAESFLDCLHEQRMFGPRFLARVVGVLASRERFQALAGEQALKACSLIESENDVSYRASLYVELARAMLPASRDEAAAYFRAGLDQMDAIGSGDYDFINELLLFAASLRGQELEDRDVHTLTNICELSMNEADRFPWFDFARGLSKVGGCRGLAKLARWDDRSKAPLRYSLLPYLTALATDEKLDGSIAVALNCLADPVELHDCGTKTFARAINDRSGATKPILVAEILRQFESDNPGVRLFSTEELASLAREVLGPKSATASYLAAAGKKFTDVNDVLNVHRNYPGVSAPIASNKPKDDTQKTSSRRREDHRGYVGGTCQQLWDTRELHLVSLDYGGETREVGAIDVNIDQDLVA